MPPVTTINHYSSPDVSNQYRSPPSTALPQIQVGDTRTTTQPPPNRRVAALSTTSPQPKSWFSSEVWAPTGTLEDTTVGLQ
ncbi:hypothetical protein HanIR_Chr12g0564421 [Helianthus annuus]|uniref:Uncharacterized protein n=1 Tax=Helianthus annuus TaxID=4232 RepID=A0A251SYE5_HELAN|nr:hypothetical protein HanIR_Chr12g0564421 [Helianthus annuus]